MNIFQKVTLEILKKNKVRTIVTIIGVILSASMITAVTSSISSVQNYMLENAIYREGDWHASVLEADAGVFDVLNESKQIESYVYNEEIGYAIAEGCTNEYKPYLYLMGADNHFIQKMPVHLTGGRLPKTSNEIILPEHLAENGEVHYKVGDVLTLEVGKRVGDGYRLGQYNPYMKEGEQVEQIKDVSQQENTENVSNKIARKNGNTLEWIEVEETRTYTVVGFYERPNFENYSASGYTAITVLDKIPTEDTIFNIYYKVTEPKKTLEISSQLSESYASSQNNDVLTYMGVLGYESFYTILYGLSAILIALIMFGSISLIYNAFSISVSERTKQFGLLSSIGATKKQLRNMVLFEGIIVSAIGIPLGILAGIGGMGITLYFLEKKLSQILEYPLPLKLYVYPWTIVAAFLITFVTILISAWIPSKRATMVTAVEAIRQSKDIKIKEERILKKKCKTNLSYRIFGLPGMIADKYYRRNKKKYRTTVISLFMSIVLFVSSSAFMSYTTDMIEAGYEGDTYDIAYIHNIGQYKTNAMSQEEVAKLLGDANYVTESAFVTNYTERINIEQQYISKEYLAYKKEKYEIVPSEVPKGYIDAYLGVIFVDDATYEAFLQEQKLNKELYLNKQQPMGIVFDGKSDFDYDLEKIITANILKSKESKLVIGNEEYKRELEIGTILYERPYFILDLYDIAILYPYSMEDVILEHIQTKSLVATHYIKSSDHKKTFEAIENTLVEHGLFKDRLYSMAEEMEASRSFVFVVNVFAYGFIILISLIAVANVFNTISTNISLRRREFAMLKSVGMSNKELHRMMNFECILYGSRALLYGLPVSALITWFIYKVVSDGYTAGFYLPWKAIGIAVGSVFLVVFATMMYAIQKIKAENPIDALKNDNI